MRTSKEPLAELQDLMPPPKLPVGAIGDWHHIENKLGTRLPSDYKEFVRIYGAGAIGEMPICVSSPFSTINNLQQQIDGTTEGYRLMRKLGWELPYSIFPEQNGLLAWGNTGNGDYLNWLTRGDPDTWLIVVWYSAGAEFLRFEIGMVNFLAEALSLRLKVFPSDFLKPPLLYTPSEPVNQIGP